MSFNFEPIGWLKTPFVDKFGTPRQGHLVPAASAHVQWAPGTSPEQWLQGLSGFSHVWLISVFHENLGKMIPTKVHPPRLGGRSVGVLASRSPHRPNPIGLTLARVVGVQGRDLILNEVDLLDDTPILDIKPYITECDRVDRARGGWVDENPWPRLPVFFSREAEKGLLRVYQLAPPPMSLPQLRQLIQQSLASDPRAVADREEAIRPDGRPRWFWLRLFDIDVGFFFSTRGVEVAEVRFALASALYARFEQQDQQA
ncbi:MAG: tRNA (N6-threonylcarbamoyladenosine(37)-N6)-methyltransferase TrmO [Bdellovibrionales bacterium]